MPVLLLIAATAREMCDLTNVEMVCCGIGPVEATLNTAAALAAHDAHAVLHVGIAGAADLEPGSVAIGSEAVYCDLLAAGTTLPRIAQVKPSRAMFDAACAVLPDAVATPIATSARVGGGSGHRVEAMEGFGVLRASEHAGIPALEVRVISNHPAETDRSVWRIDDALTVLHATVRTLVPALSRLPL